MFENLKCTIGLFLAGAVMTLAMPPLGLFPFLFLSITLLVLWIARYKSAFGAFIGGWVFGCGYFITGLYWFGTAFETFFGMAKSFAPFITVIVPAYIALVYGIAAAAAWHLRERKHLYTFFFSLTLFWAEYIRGHYFMNFPWNTLGYGWHLMTPMLQITSVIGIYGLTALTIFWAATPAAKGFRAITTLTLFAVAGWGSMVMLQNPTVLLSETVKIIQPDITQAEKENFDNKDKIFEKHLELTRTPDVKTPTFVIWPETAVDFTPNDETTTRTAIAQSLPQGSIGLIGVNRFEITTGVTKPTVRNSVIGLDTSGNTLAAHDKFTLAPWGEYIPFRRLLEKTSAAQLISGMNDLTAGDGPSTLKIGNLPSFSPVICFESTFSRRMVAKQRPDFLLFTTNDAWSMSPNLPQFSAGPLQHFSMGRVRAIEEGLPIIRAANTGVSAIIDAHGRILAQLPLNHAGTLTHAIPVKAKPTIFSFYGDAPLLVVMSALTGLCLLAGVALKKRRK